MPNIVPVSEREIYGPAILISRSTCCRLSLRQSANRMPETQLSMSMFRSKTTTTGLHQHTTVPTPVDSQSLDSHDL